MILLVCGFLGALITTLLLIRSAHRHSHLSHDHDQSGPQKFHAKAVPRIGGIGILVGFLIATAAAYVTKAADASFLLWLTVCGIPAFGSGLLEDVTKKVSPRRRMAFTCVSAVLAIWILHGVIDHGGLNWLDWLLAIPAIAVLITIFTIAGVTNAVNIVDGFNGLASMCVVMMLAAISYVAYQVGDLTIFYAALSLSAAILGFFVFNFPTGLIFLGDGGAYFLGFMVAELAIQLLYRDRKVSPMFALLICIYPVFETLFSVYRKKFIRKISPGVPDGVHLHMLIYKRLMRWAVGRRDAKSLTRRNSLTSPYLWLLCATSIVPAMIFWNDTTALLLIMVVFAVGYVTLYWRIVRFRAPRWMVVRR